MDENEWLADARGPPGHLRRWPPDARLLTRPTTPPGQLAALRRRRRRRREPGRVATRSSPRLAEHAAHAPPGREAPRPPHRPVISSRACSSPMRGGAPGGGLALLVVPTPCHRRSGSPFVLQTCQMPSEIAPWSAAPTAAGSWNRRGVGSEGAEILPTRPGRQREVRRLSGRPAGRLGAGRAARPPPSAEPTSGLGALRLRGVAAGGRARQAIVARCWAELHTPWSTARPAWSSRDGRPSRCWGSRAEADPRVERSPTPTARRIAAAVLVAVSSGGGAGGRRSGGGVGPRRTTDQGGLAYGRVLWQKRQDQGLARRRLGRAGRNGGARSGSKPTQKEVDHADAADVAESAPGGGGSRDGRWVRVAMPCGWARTSRQDTGRTGLRTAEATAWTGEDQHKA